MLDPDGVKRSASRMRVGAETPGHLLDIAMKLKGLTKFEALSFESAALRLLPHQISGLAFRLGIAKSSLMYPLQEGPSFKCPT
jgi:hypothetical protein